MFESSMENLHSDIVLDIFSRLPVESVLNCKRVCKTWQTLLHRRRKYFADMHIRRQLLLLDDDHTGGAGAAKVGVGLLFSFVTVWERVVGVELCYEEFNNIIEYNSYNTIKRIDHPLIEKPYSVIGSCNGLICLAKEHHGINDPIYICNPITREYVYLPRFIPYKSIYLSDMASGFGYLRATNEYKVVRINYRKSWGGPGLLQVYTLGSGSGWRNKGKVSYRLCLPRAVGIFANGSLHWIDQDIWKIVAFNLEDEKFHVLPSPPCFHPVGNSASFHLQVLGGYLCLVHLEPGRNVEMWLLKKNSGCRVKDQEFHSWIWSKEFSIAWEGPIEYPKLCMPLTLEKCNTVLLQLDWTSLYGYDTKTATLKKLWDDMDLPLIQAIPHMNSFVSLRALGEKSRRRRRRTQTLPGQLKEY